MDALTDQRAMHPLILNIDDAVCGVSDATRIDARHWHERIRFGCTTKTYQSFAQEINACLPDRYGTALLGSGDFHHLSLLLIQRVKATRPLTVVVFDNHPDNMRFPLGVHCGSWVRSVAALPAVGHVHMVGMTSGDMGVANAWSHYLRPLRAGKLTYWSTGVDTSWSKWLGVSHAFRSFHSVSELIAAFEQTLRRDTAPVYLSIDKDVLHEGVVQTNWDQGNFDLTHLDYAMRALGGRVVASDITGDISEHQYTTQWKRVLARLDGQQSRFDAATLMRHQHEQARCNRHLIDAIQQLSA